MYIYICMHVYVYVYVYMCVYVCVYMPKPIKCVHDFIRRSFCPPKAKRPIHLPACLLSEGLALCSLYTSYFIPYTLYYV